MLMKLKPGKAHPWFWIQTKNKNLGANHVPYNIVVKRGQNEVIKIKMPD